MPPPLFWIWSGFILLVLAMLALDLGVFNRKAHVITVREALGWSAVWITLSLLFSGFVYFAYKHHWGDLGLYPARGDGPTKLLPTTAAKAALMYLTGYVIEYSLSVDNIFVIALIFGYFKIPAIHQHRVLFWGILGAVVMRGAFIGVGTALIQTFHWVIYLFGAFLLFTAYKMLAGDEDPDPSRNPLVRFVHRYFPFTDQMHGRHFAVREGSDPTGEPVGVGKWVLTPLALALIVVEGTDVVFAVDSIPAIFAVTHDPFLVFTSNIFAVLGLRSLYFALAGILDKFYYLKTALAGVLAMIGAKMILADVLHKVPFLDENLSYVTLGLIVLILAAGVVASLVRSKRLANQPLAASQSDQSAD